MRLDDTRGQQAVFAKPSPSQTRAACNGKLPPSWAHAAAAHLAALALLRDGQVEAAATLYNSDDAPHLLLVEQINADEENQNDLTLAAGFERSVGNARQLAELADRQLTAAGQKAGKVCGRLCVFVQVCVVFSFCPCCVGVGMR